MNSTVVPRGIRNNNPGNIRKGTAPWVGLAADQPDPDFCTFMTPEYGIRAIAKILETYKAHGVDTVQGAIDKWAPPTENDTTAYVQDVCLACSVGPSDAVDLADPIVAGALIRAIIHHENGEQPYTDQQINAGIALA